MSSAFSSLVSSVIAVVAFAPAPSLAQSERDASAQSEPSALSLRLGMLVGGAYTTNAFSNAAGLNDNLGIARLSLDADYALSDWALFKLTYRGDTEMYQEIRTERQVGNVADLTLGLRPSDSLYLSMRVGGENAYYPKASLYSFSGLFGQAGLRLELGDSATLKGHYRLRRDAFPNYDLDNTSHTGQLLFELALGDHVDLDLPVELTATSYSERYLLDGQGNATGTRRTGRAWRLEPTARVQPSFSLRITGSARGEWNDSDDSYYYAGPFGASTTSVPPELINNFDSYWGASSRWEVRWQPLDGLIATIRAAGGVRWYSQRPAYDSTGLSTGEKEKDYWLQPGAELEWRFSSPASLTAAYSYLRQVSNDALWSFDGHRVDILLGFWLEN